MGSATVVHYSISS